jgi:hypothetical protein
VVFFLRGVLSDERTGLQFAVQSLGPLSDCSAITQWPKSRRTRNDILPSHVRLPQPGGQVPIFISPRNRVAQLYPWACSAMWNLGTNSLGTRKIMENLDRVGWSQDLLNAN